MKNLYTYNKNAQQKTTRTPRYAFAFLIITMLCLFVAPLFGAGRKGRVVFHAGGVHILKDNATSWKALAGGDDVEEGDTLITEGSGSVKVRFPSGSYFLIMPDSYCSLDRLSKGVEADVTKITLWKGRVFCNASIRETGHIFEVGTPYLVTHAKGAVFALSHESDTSTCALETVVTNGNIALFLPKKRAERFSLTQGKTITITKENVIGGEQPTSAGTRNRFARMHAQEASMAKEMPPRLRIFRPANNEVVPQGKTEVSVSGETAPFFPVSIAVGGSILAQCESSSEGAFNATVSLAAYAEQTSVDVTVESANYAGAQTKTMTLLFDADATRFTVTTPHEGAFFTSTTIPFKGNGAPGATVSIDGYEVRVDDNGSFSAQLLMERVGERTVTIEHIPPKGTRTRLTRTFTIDMETPAVFDFEITGITNGVLVERVAETRVTASTDTASVMMNGTPLRKETAGTFSGLFLAFNDGYSNLAIDIADYAGNTFRETRRVYISCEPPYLLIEEPMPFPIVRGVVKEGVDIVIVSGTNELIRIAQEKGAFSLDLRDAFAAYRRETLPLAFFAEDRYGRKSAVYRTTATYGTSPPLLERPSVRREGNAVVLRGSIGAKGVVIVHLTRPLRVETDAQGRYEIRLPHTTQKTITIEARVFGSKNVRPQTIRMRLP